MKTSMKFQKLIRKHRKALIEAGFNQYTVRSWAYGYRIPDFDHALRLSGILHIPLPEIPYRQIIFNRP